MLAAVSRSVRCVGFDGSMIRCWSRMEGWLAIYMLPCVRSACYRKHDLVLEKI
jgi:hypothetical protein